MKYKIGRMVFGFLALVAVWIVTAPLDKNLEKKWVFYDRNGEILWSEKAFFQNQEICPEPGESCERIQNFFASVEDKNFRYHLGVRPLRIAKSLIDGIRTGEIKSGGSTITMQVVTQKFLQNRPHDIPYKIAQIRGALKLELRHSKDEIFTEYLSIINFGNGAIGLPAAASRYWDKSHLSLSIGEMATLVSILPNPSYYDPIKFPDHVTKRRNLVLQIWADDGLITQVEKTYWSAKTLELNPNSVREFHTPHFVLWAQQKIRQNQTPLGVREVIQKNNLHEVHTTIDKSIYKRTRKIIQGEISVRLDDRNLSNAAAVILDNQTQEILAMVGGMDYFDTDRQGHVNMATANRSTGSILKPFLYALAIDQGDSPLTPLEDYFQAFPQPKGAYRPRNFHSQKNYGRIFFREALSNSYNISAVYLLQKIGPTVFLNSLQTLGINTDPEHQTGLSIILGGLESSLLQVTTAYQNLYLSQTSTSEWITHALSDNEARWVSFSPGNLLELPFPAAAKTGTSQGFRDNWVVGYTPEVTVGVWAGNNDGAPMHTLSGVEGAGPIWNKIMLLLWDQKIISGQGFEYQHGRKPVDVCRQADDIFPYCEQKFTAFVTDTEFANYRDIQPKSNGNRIVYPSSGEVFFRGTNLRIKTNKPFTGLYFLDGPDGIKKSKLPYFENLSVGNYRVWMETDEEVVGGQVSFLVE